MEYLDSQWPIVMSFKIGLYSIGCRCTLHYIFHYIALHYTTFDALHSITLHYMTLHDNTLWARGLTLEAGLQVRLSSLGTEGDWNRVLPALAPSLNALQGLLGLSAFGIYGGVSGCALKAPLGLSS